MRAPLRKLAALGPRGWRDLLHAQVALLRARWRLRHQPVGSVVVRDPPTGQLITGDARRAEELALALMRAATHGVIRPLCLARAIALRELLEAHGIRGSSIRIGVRRHQGEFTAHAWVRWGDAVLGDQAEHVASFTEVNDIRVLGPQ